MKKYHPTTATVCRYTLAAQKVSSRAMARTLGIHHTTWLRYLHGHRRPGADVKQKLAKLMQVGSFRELVQCAFRHHHKFIKM